MFLVATCGLHCHGSARWAKHMDVASMRLVSTVEEAVDMLHAEHGDMCASNLFRKRFRIYELFSNKRPTLLKDEAYAHLFPCVLVKVE